MIRLRNLAAPAAASILAVGGATPALATGAPAAGMPTCDRVAHNYSSGYNTWTPTTGWEVDCQLGRGASGPAVRVLQQALNGCYDFPDAVSEENNGEIRVDGVYGLETYRAVWNVQRRTGMPDQDVDGTYGPRTFSHMAWPVWLGSSDGPYVWYDCVRSGMG
jgi:Putative peptidoglycan binding domain